MNLETIITSEEGSLMPLWAIGGTMVMISLFWVENSSFAFLDKMKNVHVSSAVARASLIDRGRSTASLNEIARASGTESIQVNQRFYDYSIEELEEAKDNERLQETVSAKTNMMQTTSVPFDTLNESLDFSTSLKLSTMDNTVKVLHPLNIHLIVESTPENKTNISKVSQPLVNALKRLASDAPDTRMNIVPYSYRVNVSGRCYTGIARGDDFSFVWWEEAFRQEDLLVTYSNQLNSAKNSLSSANSSMASLDKKIKDLQKEQADHLPGSAEYASLQSQIDTAKNQYSSTENSIPQLEENIANAQDRYDKQKKTVDELHESETYIKYLPLAKHYAKRYQNYRYFEDYTDEVANEGDFSMPEGSYKNAALNMTASTTLHSKLSVSRNNYFGDANTCPSTSVSSNISSPDTVKSSLNAIDYTGKDLLALEGLLWAGRSIYSGSSNLTRNVAVLFISGKENSIDPESFPGAQEACNTIKNTFSSGKVSKLLVVAPDEEAAEQYITMQCATSWNSDTGFILLDDYVDDFDKEIEAKFIHYFAQESTTRNVNG